MQPGRIDILLGVDVFIEVLLHGRQVGPPGSPITFETEFCWSMLARLMSTHLLISLQHIFSFISGDDILPKFWEIEENPANDLALSPEERYIVCHFKDNHSCRECGRFLVPLLKKSGVKALGELRPQAVQRFLSLE